MLLGLSGPVQGQDRPVAVQLDEARRAFLGGLDGIDEYLQHYRETIIEGIDGRWLPILLGTGVERGDIAMMCERLGFELAAKPPYAFVMTRPADPKRPGSEVVYTYVSMGANRFAEQVDPAQQLHWLGLDDETMPENMRVSALNAINGIATVFRPSADILVIQTNYAAPKLFARCP
jgi:hypothetical protein